MPSNNAKTTEGDIAKFFRIKSSTFVLEKNGRF